MKLNNIGLMREAHIVLGTAGFLLGFVAMVVAKFGARAYIHRWIGRVYAVCMIGMALLSLPLALHSQNTFLFVIGVLTFLWVVGGWIALRQSRRAQRSSLRTRANMLLRTHLILMGSSYIAAWTAFLVNVEPLGVGGPIFWLYAFGPTVLGTLLISRASRHYAQRGSASTRVKAT